MAWPTDVVVTGDLVTAAQLNRLPILLANVTLSGDAASFDFTSIPAHWSHLLVEVYGRTTDGAAGHGQVLARFNGDSGINYDWAFTLNDGGTVTGSTGVALTSIPVGYVPQDSSPANVFGGCAFEIQNYATALNHKVLTTRSGSKYSTTTASLRHITGGGFWRNTAAIDRLTLLPNAGSWKSGSRASVYGMGTT